VFKKIFCIIFSVSVTIAAFSGCQKAGVESSKATGNVLTISYYDGNYGSEWISSIVSAYKAKKPGVTVNLKADSSLDQKAGALLESYDNKNDILFLPNTNWEYWASKNYIEDLSGLFNTNVDNGKTFKSKIQPDYLTHCRYKGKYYTVPWDDGVTGFVYNKAMFAKNNWTVPATMQEFEELLPKIKAAGIIPIAWGGKNISDWGYAANNWWAQSEGRSGMTSYLQMKLPGVYKQQGRINALMQFYNIVSDATNSMDDVISVDSSKALKMFFSSKAAMLLGGSWIESEAGDDIPADFSMAIMRIPAVNGAKDANINVAAAGGFAVIPAQSEHVGLAEDFLRFMATDEMLELYTEVTSSPRPFIYNAADTQGLSDFGKSVMDIWQSGDNLYLFSDSSLYYGVFSDWPKDGAPYLQIYSGLTTPEQAVEDNYEYVKNNWSSAMKNALK